MLSIQPFNGVEVCYKNQASEFIRLGDQKWAKKSRNDAINAFISSLPAGEIIGDDRDTLIHLALIEGARGGFALTRISDGWAEVDSGEVLRVHAQKSDAEKAVAETLEFSL